LSSDEGRTSDFPRSFFNHHRSIFDHQTPMYVLLKLIFQFNFIFVKFIYSRRLTETRSFNRSDSAPWRRSFVSTTQDRPSNTSTTGKLISIKLWASEIWFYYLFVIKKYIICWQYY